MDSISLLSKSVFIVILFVFNNLSPSWVIIFLVGILRDNLFFLKYHENNHINFYLLYHYFLVYLRDIEPECF